MPKNTIKQINMVTTIPAFLQLWYSYHWCFQNLNLNTVGSKIFDWVGTPKTFQNGLNKIK